MKLLFSISFILLSLFSKAQATLKEQEQKSGSVAISIKSDPTNSVDRQVESPEAITRSKENINVVDENGKPCIKAYVAPLTIETEKVNAVELVEEPKKH